MLLDSVDWGEACTAVNTRHYITHASIGPFKEQKKKKTMVWKFFSGHSYNTNITVSLSNQTATQESQTYSVYNTKQSPEHK